MRSFKDEVEAMDVIKSAKSMPAHELAQLLSTVRDDFQKRIEEVEADILRHETFKRAVAAERARGWLDQYNGWLKLIDALRFIASMRSAEEFAKAFWDARGK